MSKLVAWKGSEWRKPLLLMGARQVGKTTLLEQFGKAAYKSMVIVNFDDEPNLKAIFEQDRVPSRILRDLRIAKDTQIIPGETLLVFDEIQECPNALSSLKYFNEKANEYHVIGAGSLLGVKLANTQGFPVGKVQFQTLYPLNFMEYLNALNEIRLEEYLTSLVLGDTIALPIHEKLLARLREYFFVGGMPEAVVRYRETEDFNAVREVHTDIIQAYDLDFTKHAPDSLIMKITNCFHSIVPQLAKENKKFIYSVVRDGARARDYEDAIEWLVQAGLFHKVYNVTTPKLPLKAYRNKNIFKVYLLDVGLLNTMAELSITAILNSNQLFQEFRGALMENFAVQELVQQNKKLHYWTSTSRAEVDFVLNRDDAIYPMDIKAGYSKQKKSLLAYDKKYKPPMLFRASPNNLIQQEKFVNLPLYLLGRFNQLCF